MISKFVDVSHFFLKRGKEKGTTLLRKIQINILVV